MFGKGVFTNKQQIVKPPPGPISYESLFGVANQVRFNVAVPDLFRAQRAHSYDNFEKLYTANTMTVILKTSLCPI